MVRIEVEEVNEGLRNEDIRVVRKGSRIDFYIIWVVWL